jgi:hypothetical protein
MELSLTRRPTRRLDRKHREAPRGEGVTSLKTGKIEGCSRENLPEGLGVFPKSRENPVLFPKIRESPGGRVAGGGKGEGGLSARSANIFEVF